MVLVLVTAHAERFSVSTTRGYLKKKIYIKHISLVKFACTSSQPGRQNPGVQPQLSLEEWPFPSRPTGGVSDLKLGHDPHLPASCPPQTGQEANEAGLPGNRWITSQVWVEQQVGARPASQSCSTTRPALALGRVHILEPQKSQLVSSTTESIYNGSERLNILWILPCLFIVTCVVYILQTDLFGHLGDQAICTKQYVLCLRSQSFECGVRDRQRYMCLKYYFQDCAFMRHQML